MKSPKGTIAEFERALASGDEQPWVLRLCISGMSPRSREAILNLRRVCETYLPADCQVEVIDLYQQPELAAQHQILATPTLLKSSPPPPRKLVGDLSDTEAMLRRLGIAPKDDQ